MTDIPESLSVKVKFRIKAPHASAKKEDYIEKKIPREYFDYIKRLVGNLNGSCNEDDFREIDAGFALESFHVPNGDGTYRLLYQEIPGRALILNYKGTEIARVNKSRSEEGQEYVPSISVNFLRLLREKGVSIDKLLDDF